MKKNKSKVKNMDNIECHESEGGNEESEVSDWPIFTIKSSKQNEITVNLKLRVIRRKWNWTMSRASVSILSETDYYKENKAEPLKPSNIVLKTYTNETVTV